MEFFQMFWYYALFNFVTVLAFKCADVITYKKLGKTDRAGRLIFLSLLTLEASHLAVACVEALIAVTLSDVGILAPIAFIPLFTVLPIVILYFVERKKAGMLSGNGPFQKALRSNIILALMFDISYAVFFWWYMTGSVDDTLVIMGSPYRELVMKWETIFWIGITVLLILFISVKILLSVISARKTSKDPTAEQQQSHENQVE